MSRPEQNTIRKVLIANRGEIAVRIMRTCRRLGIFTVAIYSDADAGELFVRSADEAIRIGGNNPSESYLDQDKVISAAKQSGADAIHPGYGFLSENTVFASRCKKEGIVFIGPNANAIEAMGSKIRAKEIMGKAGVPIIPGYNGEKQDTATLCKEALKIGFPVLLKASAGGGGKGMRVVRSEKELEKAITAAKRESKNAFGDDDLLIEKYFESSRHIEIQIFGDQLGNYIHLGERECTIQRRHQKVIEESPSPAISDKTRSAMADAAIKAAAAISYDNAGTVEFIYSGKGEFYFLEVNTRLQVEHPVTEMVTGLDLVEMQIHAASGKALKISQEEVSFAGHALECRLYAEDPGNDYLPETGSIIHWSVPEVEGLRIDSGIDSGSEISIFYDPMIAKIITYGEHRDQAIARMSYSLRQLEIAGLTNNKEFLLQVIDHKDFIAGDFDTHFLDHTFEYQDGVHTSGRAQFAMASLAFDIIRRRNDRTILSEIPSGWRNNFYQPQQAAYTIEEDTVELEYRFLGDTIIVKYGEKTSEITEYILNGNTLLAEIDGVSRSYSIRENNDTIYIHSASIGSAEVSRVARFGTADQEADPGGYNAPMPGQVIDVMVKPGDQVKKGDTLLILLSMKMENAVEAMEDGEVEEVFVKKDAFVEAESPLIKIKV